MSVPVKQSDRSSESLTRLTRADLTAHLSAYRSAAVRVARVGTAGVIGGLVIGLALMVAGEQLGWAESLQPYFFFGGWAITLTAAAIAWRFDRGIRAAYQISCPSCNAHLLADESWGHGVSRTELTVSTGACPSCGANIYESPGDSALE
jgi:hypothetical protein